MVTPKAWQFHRAEWAEIDDPRAKLGPASITREDYDPWMRRLGYIALHPVVAEGFRANAWSAWRRSDPEGHPDLAAWQYIYEWDHCESIIECVYITDFPSWVLWQQFIVANDVHNMTETLATLHTVLCRFFHAVHHHHPYDVCGQCDPDEYTRQRERRERRRAP